MIKIQKLSKSFGSNHVLREIDFEFRKGKIYGVVGENGSGKTTLFKCIAGLENFEGDIKSELVPLKNYLGLLLTEPYFIPKMTAREYIMLMCNARRKKNINVDQKNIFDLPLDQYASQYSTGMKKKLAFLTLLLLENDYFILDEPFNGVDIQSNLIISEILKELKSLDKTVIISSHILSSLTDICDEIVLLKNGDLKDRFSKENFKSLTFEMQRESISNKIKSLDLK